MTEPTFGLSITRVDNDVRPAVASDMSVIGLVGTALAADVTAFPLNTPVQLFSDDKAMLTLLGATGTLPDAIVGINDQLGEFQVAAKIVVVRVAEGVDADATITNIVGSSSAKTGIWALPEAGPVLGIIPRLIAVPGYTEQQKKGVTGTVITAAGTGYTTAPTIAFSGGGGTGAAATATVAGGLITGITITNPGSGYTSTPTIAFSGGGGTGGAATASVDALANPVVAALPPVLEQLLGVAVVQGPATMLADFTNYVETINHKRIIALETKVKVGVSATVKDAASRVLGIAVRRDHEKGGRPFHSWANQQMYGIVGANRNIRFSLTDGATEGQAILAAKGGVILRGEAGVETAIASGGFVFVGTMSTSGDVLDQIYSKERGRDYIHLLFLKTLKSFLGVRNINLGTIEDIINTMKASLAQLQATGDILGYKVEFARNRNTPENLRLGRIVIGFKAEEAPVLSHIGIDSQRYAEALDFLIDDLISGTDATVA